MENKLISNIRAQFSTLSIGVIIFLLTSLSAMAYYHSVTKSDNKEEQKMTWLTKYNAKQPQLGVMDIHREMDRMFENFFDGFGLPSTLNMPEATGFMPKIDVHETDKSYELSAELPGLNEDDVEISLDDNILIISGEKKHEYEEKGKNTYRMERSYGSFKRQFTLPANVDAEAIDAKFNNGVLNISIPKTEQVESKAKKIEIKH